MQMLVNQRKKLEEELLLLEDEILNTVWIDFEMRGFHSRLTTIAGKETSPKNPEVSEVPT